MLLVIDGFNLIYKFPELEVLMYESKLKNARLGLLNLLSQYNGKKEKNRFYVFFDGKKDLGNETRADSFGSIKIFYSHELKADDLIKQFIKENLSPGNLHVVTSDKEIIHFSKKYKCKVISSEDFSKKVAESMQTKVDLEKEQERQSGLSKEEVSYWYEIFSKKGKPN
jgi:uncharacterized protein